MIKKHIAIFFIMFLAIGIYAQTTSSIQTLHLFENMKTKGNLFYIENPYSATGNGLGISPEGRIYIFQCDQKLIYELDNNTFNAIEIYDFHLPAESGFTNISELYFELSTSIYTHVAINRETGEYRFKVNVYPIEPERYFYYEKSDILFFVDNKYKLYSIVSPSMDQEKNKTNYRDHEATMKLFEPGSGVDLQGLTLDAKGFLYVNGIKYYWHGVQEGKHKYQIVDNKLVSISDGIKSFTLSTVSSDNEISESTEIHPSGDIYFLTHYTSTNKHILYRIENTWDPVYRAEWYKNAAARDAALMATPKATVNDDNVRIRKEPTLHGTQIGMLQKGESVKILEKSKDKMKIGSMDDYWYYILTDSGVVGWSYGTFLDIAK